MSRKNDVFVMGLLVVAYLMFAMWVSAMPCPICDEVKKIAMGGTLQANGVWQIEKEKENTYMSMMYNPDNETVALCLAYKQKDDLWTGRMLIMDPEKNVYYWVTLPYINKETSAKEINFEKAVQTAGELLRRFNGFENAAKELPIQEI